MKYLNDLIDNTTSWWDCSTHVSSKKANKKDLMSLQLDLFSQYDLYERVISLYMNNPVSPSFVNEDRKKLLLDYYNNPPILLKNKLQERRNNDLKVCPYCGSYTQPNTLDHFIPKDNFSHYSIFQNNLVPQCRRCASIKGDRYYQSEEGCIFIHPFYSDILSRVKFNIYLSFDISINSININDVKVSCENSTHVEIKRIKSHLKALKVKSRIKEYCLNEFKELRRKAKKYHFDLDQWIFSKTCIVEINGLDWCTAFYESLKNCSQAKNFLIELMPVPNKVKVIQQPMDFDFD